MSGLFLHLHYRMGRFTFNAVKNQYLPLVFSHILYIPSP